MCFHLQLLSNMHTGDDEESRVNRFPVVYFTIPLSHDIMQTRLSFNALPCFAFDGAKAEVESFAPTKLFD